jgi:hypothetical protein
MVTTYTSRGNLQKPANDDRGWDVPLNANTDALDGNSLAMDGMVTPAENPSSTLRVKVAACQGGFRKSNGTVGAWAGTPAVAVAPSTTNYLYLNDSGTLVVTAVGWPASAHGRLATVVTDGSKVTQVNDMRFAVVVCGVNVFAPQLPGLTAGATYTSNEQSMLQQLWSKVQAAGA